MLGGNLPKSEVLVDCPITCQTRKKAKRMKMGEI